MQDDISYGNELDERVAVREPVVELYSRKCFRAHRSQHPRLELQNGRQYVTTYVLQRMHNKSYTSRNRDIRKAINASCIFRPGIDPSKYPNTISYHANSAIGGFHVVATTHNHRTCSVQDFLRSCTISSSELGTLFRMRVSAMSKSGCSLKFDCGHAYTIASDGMPNRGRL